MNLSVLIVEDSDDDAFLAKAVLQKSGYSVDYRRVDTSEALKTALETASWDLVLSDYNLPGFSGLKALIIVRNFDQEIPFIVVSGSIGEDTAVAMMKAGATDYVKKDQLQILPVVVEKCIGEREVRRDNRESHAALLRSQAQLNNALEMARLGHWEYDVLEDTFTFNDQFYSIFKTSAEKAGGYAMDSKTYARLFVHPDDIQKVKAESLKAINVLDANYTSQFEHRTIFPDGKIGFLSIRFSVAKDEKGRTVRVYGVVQDITEFLEKQEIIKENEARYRSIFENSTDAILLTSPDGAISDANPAACRLFKYSREEIIRGGRALLVDASDPRLGVALKKREETGFVFAEITMLRSDGEPVPVEVSSSTFTDAQGKPKAIVIIRDITERKKAERVLRESERKYRSLFENAQEGIFQSTQDGRYVAANKAMAKILGYDSPEDLITTVTDIPRQVYMHPDIREKILALVEEFGSVQSYECLYKRKDGSPLWASVSLHPVFDDRGSLLHYQGFMVDVTERRNSLEKLKKALRETVFAISASVDAKDPYTAGHQARVADLAVAIADEMGLSEEEKEGLRLAAMIHDLGKLSVPTEVLTKPRKLLEAEFELIKTHCSAGYDILSKLDFPWPIARMVLEHHERIDGSGYPQGLAGEDTLLQSRILAVADVVESMASHRPYRPSLGLDAALAEVEANSGRLYDVHVANACLKIFKEGGYVLPTM
ncbi:MAG TPA: PAS domain S-box protein [Rectinemataceae bacterium]